MENELRKSLVAEPFTKVGGYPRFGIMGDGAPLCHKCAEDHSLEIDGCDEPNHEWFLQAVEINWESELQCSNCGDEIQSAYEPVEADA